MVIMLYLLLGSIVGTVGLCALTLLFHLLFFRPTLADGQYMFVFFVAVPVGIILGALTGLVIAYVSEGQRGTAGHIAQFWGTCLIVVFLLLGMFVLSGTEKPNRWERLEATIFWFALPLLWAGLLVKIGARLLANS